MIHPARHSRKAIVRYALFILVAIWVGGIDRSVLAEDIPPYKNSDLAFEVRAADLVSRMTFDEKATQMQSNAGEVARLGIPATRFGLEAMHGVQSGGTTFPDSMALAAMWDPDLLHTIAGAIGDEARAVANRSGAPVQGLILWCPTVNLARDPRWGRNQESYGEDPLLAGRLGAAYCQGLQGDDPKYLKTIATPKHFVVYSQEASRQSSNATVSERALREYYLPPFEACFVEGKAQSTMSAYNAINGIPCSANEWLLTSVLRDEWKFAGAVVTDSRAVNQVFTGHHYTESEELAVAAAINSGVDVITDAASPQITTYIKSAEAKGLFKPGAVDRAVTNSLLVRFRLGLFDPPEKVAYRQIPYSMTRSQEHMDLALQAARESIVLLQNNPAPRGYGFEKLLPLDLRRVTSIAVVGQNANQKLYGSYSPGGPNLNSGGEPVAASSVIQDATPVAGIKAILGDRINLHYAADDNSAIDAARNSDVVIFVGGLDNRQEHTGADRPNLDIPIEQRLLLDKVIKANPMTILILTGGSGINLDGLKEKVPAMVMFWYNGEQGARALAETLVGANNPSGKLPATFYRTITDLPLMSDYEVVPGPNRPGRTYMYFQNPVSYAFGHGLSYTSFDYKNLRIVPSPTAGGPMTASIEITNTGIRDGDEVVQFYARDLQPPKDVARPIKQLVAFQRVHISGGQTRSVTVSIPLRNVSYWNTERHQFVVNPGSYEWMAGASSEDIRVRSKLELK